MIKVLIIDDEIWICQLIQKLIDWNAAGFEIIGEAHDGYRGMEMIQKMHPQLVLVDIRMPGMDGVELIRRTREQKLDTQFMIVSGYSDFVYAQKALKYGALGYILKPIDQEELLDFLLKIKEKIFTSAAEEKEKQELQSRLDMSLWQLKEQYFRNIFREEGKILPALAELNGRFECHFAPGCYRVVIYQLDRTRGSDQMHEMNEVMMTKLSRYFTDVFRNNCYDTFIFYESRRLIQILNYAPDRKREMDRNLRELRKKVNDEQKLELGIELTIGAGTEKGNIENLFHSYREARNSIRSRWRYGIGNLIEAGQKEYEITEWKDVLTTEDEKRIEGYAHFLDIEEVSSYIHGVLKRIAENEQVSPALLTETAVEIANLFLRTLMRNGIRGEQMPQEWKKISECLENCCSLSQTEACVIRVFAQAQERFELGEKSRNDKVIAIVKQYIAEHYREDISLKVLADQVCLNPKYFGELFKKETGMNYSDYLAKYRIEAAEHLLRDVRNRISEVGEMVGYKDSKYFSKLFKKMTGLSPAQYRKMFS